MIASPPWERRRSTARRRGRTRTASPGASPTRASRARRWPRPNDGSASSTAARRCSSPPARRRARRWCSRSSSPGQTVAIAEGAYYGTGVMLDELARWGVAKVEFDQTGRAARRRRPRLARGTVEPVPDDAELRGRGRASRPASCATRRRRRRSTSGRSSSAATSRSTRRRSTSPAMTTRSSARSCASGATTPRGCSSSARAPAPFPRPTRRGSSCADSRRSRCAWRDRRRVGGRPRRAPSTATLPCTTVRYPGFGGLLSFDVRRRRRGAPASRPRRPLIANMTSLGGVTSRIEARARWEGARVPPGLLRLSVGLEDPDALWDDLERALDAI